MDPILAQPRARAIRRRCFYARLNDAGAASNRKRNLIFIGVGPQRRRNTRGGMRRATSMFFWHAPLVGRRRTKRESPGVGWRKSSDDGKTFARERVPFDSPTGVCGCCGMHAFVGADGAVQVLFSRGVPERSIADMYLLTSHDRGGTFQGTDISPVDIGACVMSYRGVRADERRNPGGVGDRKAGLLRRGQSGHRATTDRRTGHGRKSKNILRWRQTHAAKLCSRGPKVRRGKRPARSRGKSTTAT